MRAPNPSWRGKAVLEAFRSDDPLPHWAELPEAEFYTFLVTPEDERDETMSQVFSLYSSDFCREAMSAWILSNATDEQFELHLRIPKTVAMLYRRLFFDPTIFQNRLQLLEWANAYKGTSVGEFAMKRATLDGVTMMIWLYTGHDPEFDPIDAQRKIAADSFYSGRAYRLYGGSSKEAKAAHDYFKTALEAARAITSGKSREGVQGMLIKLLHRDNTQQATTLEKSEFLH